jgi:hypothetical protein
MMKLMGETAFCEVDLLLSLVDVASPVLVAEAFAFDSSFRQFQVSLVCSAAAAEVVEEAVFSLDHQWKPRQWFQNIPTPRDLRRHVSAFLCVCSFSLFYCRCIVINIIRVSRFGRDKSFIVNYSLH